jgi:hypothetical protein
MGVYSVNEIREMEGQNSIGSEGDVRVVPMNMTTLEAMANTPADAMVQKLQPKLPPAGGSQEGGDPADDEGALQPGASTKPDARNAVLGSVQMVVGGALERYQKRLANREADLRRRDLPEPKIQVNLAEERGKQRPRLIDECQSAFELLAKWCPLARWTAAPIEHEAAVLLAADDVDNGTAPDAAALHLLERLAATESK